MKNLETPGIRLTAFRLNPFIKKLLILLFSLFLSFSMEKGGDTRLAQIYFYRGYTEYTQGNYPDAIINFSKAYLSDKEGYYGELAYLYIGISYAHVSYRKGNKEGLLSAVAYLNMYPYYYKKATYLFLQKEFIGDTFIMLNFYDKARDIFLSLYKDTGRVDYLLKFLYADALYGGSSASLLDTVDPSSLLEKEYLYYFVKGIYAFNGGNYKDAMQNFARARELNRYLEEDPEFLYRYAVSSFLEKDWRRAVFYFELLDRKDLYKKYADSMNYYLALLYLMNKNYGDARNRIQELLSSDGIKSSLLIAQLWLYPEFIKKYESLFKNYKKDLVKIGWKYINSIYSIPAILGMYYYALEEGKVEDRELLRLKKLQLPSEIVFKDIRIETEPMLKKLREKFKEKDPYGRDGDFMIELYKINAKNYALLFGYEALARAVVYRGLREYRAVVERVEEPIRSFLLGQLLLLDGMEEGVKLIENAHKTLSGEDKQEALFILGLYRKDPKMLEPLTKEKVPARFEGYLSLTYLELGDYYYDRRDYTRAKEYYRKYLEKAEEDDTFWLTAYKYAKAGERTGDREAINWVVKRAEKKDNILSRVIIAIWG